MAQRAKRDGVAEVAWRRSAGGRLEGWASGPAEAASHVETTLTQATEEVVIAAQVRGGPGPAPTAAELLASALARLALGVATLNVTQSVHSTPMFLFSGRRASSRRYLVLQNWYCAKYLQGWRGCSCVMVTALLDRAVEEVGGGPEARSLVGPLAGTLAHEIVMVTDQLLGAWNDLGAPGGAGSEPQRAQVTSLLAHLLFLVSTDRVSSACALPDTLGTRGFVAAALAARLPAAFVADVQGRYPDDWRQSPVVRWPHPDGTARVFDLFPTWRIDSGDYAEMASVVVDAWEGRWRSVPNNRRPPRPQLINSNLDGWEEIIDVSRLPPRIRPSAFAFGTLADGFLPGVGSRVPGNAASPGDLRPTRPVDLELCSVVMKAVAARHPAATARGLSTPSAVKLGDDDDEAKLEYDTRVSPTELQAVHDRAKALSKATHLDADAVSKALADAYVAVAHEGLLRC